MPDGRRNIHLLRNPDNQLLGEREWSVLPRGDGLSPQFKELYHRLAVGLSGVHWSSTSSTIEQDVSPHTRASLIKKLPANLRVRLTNHYSSRPGIPPKEADESAFWVRIAGDPDLPDVLRKGQLFHLGISFAISD